jgi:hypothetical protein
MADKESQDSVSFFLAHPLKLSISRFWRAFRRFESPLEVSKVF